jgi:uncharacterized membrane protein (DUF4010 family)
LFSGLSFVAYIARRIVGPGRGYFVTGLLGGLVSSTNVTFTFARTSRTDPLNARAVAVGAVAGNAMLYPRVLVATAVLNLPLLPLVFPYLVLPGLVAAAVATIGFRRTGSAGTPAPAMVNPLQLTGALQMALVFQAVLMLVHLAGRTAGDAGVFVSATVLGLTDVDALTVSMARGVAETASLHTAAAAIALGVLSNTGLKLAVALVFGSPPFKQIAGGTLAVMILAAAAAFALPLP